MTTAQRAAWHRLMRAVAGITRARSSRTHGRAGRGFGAELMLELARDSRVSQVQLEELQTSG